MSEEENKTINYLIGDILPSDEVLSRWIILFTMAYNDLTYINRLYVDSVEEGATFLKGEQIYLFRVSSSHLREAIKLVYLAERQPAVKVFFDRLPEEAKNKLKALRVYYQEYSQSFVYMVLKDVRDCCFHYSQEVFDKLQEFLEIHKHRESSVIIGKYYKDTRISIGDEASTYLVNEVFSKAEYTIPKAIELTANIISNVIDFIHLMLIFYYRERTLHNTVRLDEA